MTDEFVCLHSSYDQEHPADLAYAKAIEARRSVNGLPPSREFPCHGALRTVSRCATGVVAGCDACPFEVFIPSKTETGAVF